jgi:HEAT repeats
VDGEVDRAVNLRVDRAGDLPSRPGGRPSPRELLGVLAAGVGSARAAALCAELLAADDPGRHAELVLFLGGPAGRSVLEGGGWKPSWARVWGARGLLYVWDDASESLPGTVLAGLHDEHWRVAEMCLKVAARRELPAGDGAVSLAGHDLPRVRATAARLLGVAGDSEHLPAVRELLEDESSEVRRAAARALERLEDRLDLPGR